MTPLPEPLNGKRGPRRRRRVLWLTGALVVTAAGLGGWLYARVADPERVRAAAEHYLGEIFAGPVSIGGAAFSWSDGVRLFDLSVGPATSAAPRAADVSSASTVSVTPVLTCREVRIRHDAFAALTGTLRVRSITAVEPNVNVVQDLRTERLNLTGWLRGDRPRTSPRDSALPALEVVDGRVHFRARDASGDQGRGDVALSLRALPSSDLPGAYDVVWRSGGADGHVRVDPQTGGIEHVSGGLPPISARAAVMALAPRVEGAAAWADRVGLRGTLQVTGFTLASPGSVGFTASVEVRDAAMSVSLDEAERQAAPDQRYARLDGLTGRVRLSDERVSAELSGRLRGSAVNLALTIEPEAGGVFTDAANVRLTGVAMAKGVALPRAGDTATPGERRVIGAVPALATWYRELDPQGRADLDVHFARRAGTRTPIEITKARIDLLDGACTVPGRAGRLTDLRGVIEYAPAETAIRGLFARRGESTITIDGRLAGPTIAAAKTFHVVADGVQLDDDFWAVLPAEATTVRQRFEPSGSVDLAVDLRQQAGSDDAPGSWSARGKAELRDVSIRYDEFPYPLTSLGGAIEFDEDSVQLDNVHGRAGAGTVEINGRAKLAPEGLAALDLVIAGKTEFDMRLLRAMPATTEAFVQQFHPAGPFSLKARLSLDPETHALQHETLITLDSMSMRFDMFDIPLSAMTGRLEVRPREVLVDGVTGVHGSARFSIDGTIARVNGSGGTALRVVGQDVALDEEFRRALPPTVRDGLAAWTIEGPFSVETVVTGGGPDDGPLAIRTNASLTAGRVSHPFFPAAFDDVTAEISVDDAGFRAKKITARYGTSAVSASVRVYGEAGEPVGDIELTATGLTLDNSVRGLARGRFADDWDRVKPVGDIDVHLNELGFRPVKGSPDTEWSVSGYVEFRQLAMPGLGRTQRATGSLLAHGTLADGLGGQSLSGRVALVKAEVLDQRITQADASWSFARNADSAAALSLRDMQGRMYNGIWSAQADLRVNDGHVEYDVLGTLQHVQIEPMLRAESTARRTASDPLEVQGLVSGQLSVSGVMGDAESRRGGGRFEINEGRLYRLPLILAILNVLNLTSPMDEAFDHLQTAWLIDGNRIELTDIVLRGKSLALTGRGTMNWPDRGVDLSLIHGGGQGWRRVPLLTDFLTSAAGEVVELHITGPIYQPNVRTRTLRGVADEVKRLFQKQEPKKNRPSS